MPSSETRRAGFCLVELVTVVAIILVLSRGLFAIPGDHVDAARRVQLTTRARQVETACDAYYRRHGRWPERIAELEDSLLVGRLMPYDSLPDLEERISAEERPRVSELALLLLSSAPGRHDVAGARVVAGAEWHAARPPGGWGW